MSLAKKLLLAVVALLALIAAAIAYFVWFHVRITSYPVPERVSTAPDHDVQQSVVVTSIAIPIQEVRRGMERDLPRTLVAINERVEECVPRETVRLFKRNLFRTPRVGCNLVGEVRRGSITMGGSGRTLTASFPVNAEIHIRDIGDVIKQETATATAIMKMRASLGVSGDWRLRPDIRISYNWYEEPSIVFAGQQIRFTKQADAELAKILRRVEASLEAEIRKVNLRSEIANAWRGGFDSISLNRENPPVWLRLSPEQAGASGLRVAGNQLITDLMLGADLEVFVGEQPAKPEPKPLGANIGVARGRGFDVTIPVLADYSEVEPVILRALQKLAAKGVSNEDLGKLEVSFDEVTLYATKGGRIAVGVATTVEPVGNITGRIWGRSSGKVWLTGQPLTQPGSEIVSIEGLQVFGDMDSDIGDLLVRVLGSDEVRSEIERALVEDFAKDYEDIMGKARRGIRSVRVGGFDLSFDVASVEHGAISATGHGLFMPVTAKGDVATRVRN